MTRSLKKGPYIDPRLLEKLVGKSASTATMIKTWARSSQISPEMAAKIDHEVKKIIDAAYKKATSVLAKLRSKLDMVAKELMKIEKYYKKGDLISAREVLKYLDRRDKTSA